MSFSGLTRKSECIYYNHFEIVAQDANDIWNLLDITVPEQGGGMSVANHGHSDPSPAAAWQAERGERPAAASIPVELWSFYKCGYFISTQTGYSTPSKV